MLSARCAGRNSPRKVDVKRIVDPEHADSIAVSRQQNEFMHLLQPDEPEDAKRVVLNIDEASRQRCIQFTKGDGDSRRLERLNQGYGEWTERPDFKAGEIRRRVQCLVRTEVLETTRLPPSEDTDPGPGPEILCELLPKRPVEN